MSRKTKTTQAAFLTVLFLLPFCGRLEANAEYTGEKIIYLIDPAGVAEYRNLGVVEVDGRKLNLVTFETKLLGFRDTEKIYLDSETNLPVRVERDVGLWTKKEYLVEKYDQEKSQLIVEKYNHKKKVKEYFFKVKGPIHNAVFLPFFLRDSTDFHIGWSMEVSFPQTFEIQLVSLEQIRIPAGEFWAYHFTSIPHKFEIWLSRDLPHVPLKIQGLGALGYTFSMKEHLLNDNSP